MFDLDRKHARTDHTQIVVVGAGAAGLSAAIAAAHAGAQVTVIDENPLDVNLMAQEIPLHFGQRMLSTAANRGLMLERAVANNPLIAEAEAAGVDLKLGAFVWSSEPDGTLGVADADASWLLTYDRAVFATGARDLGLAFGGWEKAGVLGAGAALSLMDRYQAFSGSRITVLGAGDLGMHVALRALDSGLEVAAVVEASPVVRAGAAAVQRVEAAGVPIYTSHAVRGVIGPDEVEAIEIVRLGHGLGTSDEQVTSIDCDTVCLAVGLVPSVELMYWSGVDMQYVPARGGYVPVLADDLQTSNEKIFVAGDAGGFVESEFADSQHAEAQGRTAGRAAAASLGIGDPPDAETPAAAVDGGAQDAPAEDIRRVWVDALGAAGGPDVVVCLCEEVTRRDLTTTFDRGATHPDHVKRLTRAGMGHCQGRRCREQIQMILSDATGRPVSEIPLASYRPPFRPLPLSVIANLDETPEEYKLYEGTMFHP